MGLEHEQRVRDATLFAFATYLSGLSRASLEAEALEMFVLLQRAKRKHGLLILTVNNTRKLLRQSEENCRQLDYVKTTLEWEVGNLRQRIDGLEHFNRFRLRLKTTDKEQVHHN